MDRALQIARVVGIWFFGLIASGAAGSVIGTAIKYGYDNQSESGILAGVCAFACFRLWMGERRT